MTDSPANCQSNKWPPTPATPTTAPSSGQPTQKVAPASVNDHVIPRGSLDVVQEPMTILSRFKVEAIVRKKGLFLISFHRTHAIVSQRSVAKPYPLGYKVPF